MGIGAYPVQADQFAGHVKAGHLLAAVLRHHRALEETESHRIERFELVTRTKQRIAALDPLAGCDQFVEPFDFPKR
jgi:hypothetical protein